jgi:uncharacterized protein YkwD
LENGLFDFTTNLSVKKENTTIKSNSKYNLLVKSQTAHQATTSTNPVDQSKIITQRILKQLRGRVNQLLKYNGYDELKYSAKKVYMQRKIYISEQLNKDTLSYTYFHFE